MSTGPVPRANHQAVWTGSEMLIFGGYESGNPMPISTTAAAYNPTTDTWRDIDVSAFSPRVSAIATWYSGQVLMWGGRSTTVSSATGLIFNPTSGLATDNIDSANPYDGYGGNEGGVWPGIWTGSQWILYGVAQYQSTAARLNGVLFSFP